MKTFWLSFVGDSGSLGCAIVDVSADEAALAKLDIDVRFPDHMEDAEWLAAALAKAHRLGVNPGGQVASWDVTGSLHLALYEREKLYSRQEIEAIDKGLRS